MSRTKPKLQNKIALKIDTVLQTLICLIGLIFLLPLFITIAILIKVTSPGPVFYKGKRIGKNEKIFTIYKFRTLRIGAEQKIGARLLNDEDDFYTPIGKFLKKTKIDELPQLFNVIKGDMNLVGPRPIRPIFLEEAEENIPLYRSRFMVKPGMTGLAQVQGGYFTHPRNKLRYELIYINKRSLWLDLKVISLTFLKLLNRWLTLGFILGVLFIFLSFLPSSFYPLFYVEYLGIRFSILHLAILLAVAWLIMKNIPTNKLYVYRSVLNWPMCFFVLVCVVSAIFSTDIVSSLRGTAYYLVTGFFISFILVNNRMKNPFVKKTAQIVAIASVGVSLCSLFEIFWVNNHAVAYSYSNTQEVILNLSRNFRLSSTFSSPVALSTYLVLGIPLLFSEFFRSKNGGRRDFWLICITISFISIFLTLSRAGFLALFVTGIIFLRKKSRHILRIFVPFFLFSLLTLVLFGGPRFSPLYIQKEIASKTAKIYTLFSHLSTKNILFGVGPRNLKNIPFMKEKFEKDLVEGEGYPFPNMHLTLILENGLFGWGIMMWLFLLVLKAIHRGHGEIKDEYNKNILWAIYSSLIGFLIAMNGLNAFFYLPIQMLFWGLIGLAIGIITHLNGNNRGFKILWRFGH